jgi:hypothetical protein
MRFAVYTQVYTVLSLQLVVINWLSRRTRSAAEAPEDPENGQSSQEVRDVKFRLETFRDTGCVTNSNSKSSQIIVLDHCLTGISFIFKILSLGNSAPKQTFCIDLVAATSSGTSQ